jgi:hypothetical protein
MAEDLNATSDAAEDGTGPPYYEIGGGGCGIWVRGDLHVHCPSEDATHHYENLHAASFRIPDPLHQYSKAGGGKWPAPIVPFATGSGRDNHAEMKIIGGGNVMAWDGVYDQSTTRLPGIFAGLQRHHIEFAVLAAHDVLPSREVEEDTIQQCEEAGLVCYMATEYRRERDLLMGSRRKYALRNDGTGAHVGLDVMDGAGGLLKTIQHPNVFPSDRLDPDYYRNRAGGRVTGQEAGTPSNSATDFRTTIEVFSD